MAILEFRQEGLGVVAAKIDSDNKFVVTWIDD